LSKNCQHLLRFLSLQVADLPVTRAVEQLKTAYSNTMRPIMKPARRVGYIKARGLELHCQNWLCRLGDIGRAGMRWFLGVGQQMQQLLPAWN